MGSRQKYVSARLDTEVIYQGLYETGQQVVERENRDYWGVAVDPVNFEKPYPKELEGVSVVHKATHRIWLDMCVQTVERMSRLFAMVLISAQIRNSN